jgi:hypothetical protein
LEGGEVEGLEEVIDGGAEHALGDAFCETVDGGDAVDVDGDVFAFDDFEFGVVDVEFAGAFFWSPEDDEAMAGGDHLLDVIDVEPTADEAGAEGGGEVFLEGDLDHGAAAAKALDGDAEDGAAEADGLLGLCVGEVVEGAAVFVALGIMSEEVFYGGDAEALELADALGGPGEVAKGLMELRRRGRVGHGASSAERRAFISSWRVTRPLYSLRATWKAMSHGGAGRGCWAPPK